MRISISHEEVSAEVNKDLGWGAREEIFNSAQSDATLRVNPLTKLGDELKASEPTDLPHERAVFMHTALCLERL